MSEYPEGYPSRGVWRFRNATRGFDFTPTLDSIQIVDAHPYDMATLGCRVVDETDTLVFQPEDRVWATFADTRIFAGHVKTRKRTQLSELGVRVYELECQDYTAKLDDSIITRKKDRALESIRSRLRWIHTHLNFEVVLDVSGVPNDESAAAANYHGMSTLEAFEQVADENNLFMQVDFDEDGDGTPTLSFFRNITDVAIFDLDDDAADYSATFPYREFYDEDDSSQLATMVYVIPQDETKAKWVIDAAQRAIYGWQQSSVSDSSIKGAGGVERIGGRFLDEFDQPLTEGGCVVHEPGLRSGQRINIKNATWGLDYVRYITEVTTTALDPHDASGEAYLRAEIKFNDRRKTRRRPARLTEGDTDIPTERPVLDFSEPASLTVSYSTGSAWGATWTHYVLSFGRLPNVYDPVPPPGVNQTDFISEGDDFGPDVIVQSSGVKTIASLAGYSNLYWSACPEEFHCGIGGGSYSGWKEMERWHKAIVPAHPANMGGMSLSAKFNLVKGLGPKYVSVMVLDSIPTAGRSGTVVGTVAADGAVHTVNIPAAYIPDEGEEIWIGFGPAWQADYDLTPYYPIGYPAVCAVGFAGGPERGNGTISEATFTSQTWRTFSVSSDALGPTTELDDENDPWSGGNTVVDMGSEGTPTVDIGGGTLVVSGEGGRGIAAIGTGEDEGEPTGPWSDPYSVAFQFTTDALGDTGDSQASEIEISTTREGSSTVGTIHFGDAGTASGISVQTAGGEEFVPITFTTDDRYAARFDDRSEGWFRAKVWLVSDGEPADWTVEVEIPAEETTDEADRMALWVRAQTGQTITVYPIGATADLHGWVHERLGVASGTTERFVTSHQFVPGTLELEFAGVFAPPSTEAGATCEAWMDYKPTAGMVVWARYFSTGG